MGDHNFQPNAASESIEMYLLRIALLQQADEPVPVPKLAHELAVSPVSASEMCKKLVDKEFIEYFPYKGVILTAQGETLARRVLRHRRLWEVFFVERLGIEPGEAEEMACRFEHVTPETLAGRLDVFLNYPLVSPQNEPIPRISETPLAELAHPLVTAELGKPVRLAAIDTDVMTATFLHQQGLRPGVTLEVVAIGADKAVLVALPGRRLSLAATVAQGLKVAPVLPEDQEESAITLLERN